MRKLSEILASSFCLPSSQAWFYYIKIDGQFMIGYIALPIKQKSLHSKINMIMIVMPNNYPIFGIS